MHYDDQREREEQEASEQVNEDAQAMTKRINEGKE